MMHVVIFLAKRNTKQSLPLLPICWTIISPIGATIWLNASTTNPGWCGCRNGRPHGGGDCPTNGEEWHAPATCIIVRRAIRFACRCAISGFVFSWPEKHQHASRAIRFASRCAISGFVFSKTTTSLVASKKWRDYTPTCKLPLRVW